MESILEQVRSHLHNNVNPAAWKLNWNLMWHNWANNSSWQIRENYIRVITSSHAKASPWKAFLLDLFRKRLIGAKLFFSTRFSGKSSKLESSSLQNSWLNIMSFGCKICETGYASSFTAAVRLGKHFSPSSATQVEESQIFDFVKIMWVGV